MPLPVTAEQKTRVSRPCAFTINQLSASFTKRVDYFQSLSREARLITPIGEKPRAIVTTLEVTVIHSQEVFIDTKKSRAIFY